MGRVDVELHGRYYPVQCEDGQEGRLREVAAFVETRIRGIVAGSTHATDTQIHVLALLTLADQLFDLRADLTKMRAAMQTMAAASSVPASGASSVPASGASSAPASGEEGRPKANALKNHTKAPSSGAGDISAQGSAQGSAQASVQTVIVRELDPEVEERYARLIDSLAERIDSVASRLARV